MELRIPTKIELTILQMVQEGLEEIIQEAERQEIHPNTRVGKLVHSLKRADNRSLISCAILRRLEGSGAHGEDLPELHWHCEAYGRTKRVYPKKAKVEDDGKEEGTTPPLEAYTKAEDFSIPTVETATCVEEESSLQASSCDSAVLEGQNGLKGDEVVGTINGIPLSADSSSL